MQYRVIKGSGGKQSVSFNCPACQDVLRTPLESAGLPVDCPTCKQGLICPGVEEWESLQASKRAASEALSRAKAKEIEARAVEQSRRTQEPTAPAASTAPVATAVDYRPPTPNITVPTYGGLTIASSVLRIYALLLYVLGFLAVGIGVVAVMQGVSNNMAAVGVVGAMTTVGPGLLLLFGAAMAHGFSAALQALRDIAINSFR